jgi:DNA polymerase-3 subunit delta'
MTSDLDQSWPEPRANPHLVGHEAAEAGLREAWDGGRLHHAWLIAGPRGIGKATLAYRLARFVLAGGQGARPDGLAIAEDHPVFRRVASGGHGDLRVLEIQMNEKTGKMRTSIDVEQSRDLAQFLSLKPAEGGWRVALVDAADDLNTSSANAILKLVEEPPPRTLMILVAHAPAALLPTIRSRCQRLILRALSPEAASDLIAPWLPDDVPAAERLELARLAEGSPGRALTLHAQGGLSLQRELLALLAPLGEGKPVDVRTLHALAGRLGGRAGADTFGVLTELLGAWLTRLVRLGASNEAPAGATDDLLVRMAGRAHLERWIEVWEKLNALVERTEAVNLDQKQVLIALVAALEKTARGAAA